jgi:hypothetical protein
MALRYPPGVAIPKVAGHILFGVAPFLMPQQKDSTIPQSTHATNQGLIIVAPTVSMKFNEVVAEHLNEVERARPMRVTSNLNLLGWG